MTKPRPPLTSKILRGLVTMSGMADLRREAAKEYLSPRELDEWDTADAWILEAETEKDRCRRTRQVREEVYEFLRDKAFQE